MNSELLPDGTKRLSLSRTQFEQINEALRGFYQRTKCSALLLADSSGMLVAHAGTLDVGAKSLLSTLAAGNYAATNEIARLAGEASGFKVHFLEGSKNSVYVSGVDENFFLVVVFGETTTFGMVRVLTAKLSEQVHALLSLPIEGEVVEITRREVESPEFRDELSSRLDAVLFNRS
jgi:predicted regulator of Ras-like GTPase activity (Roadblock/LC7/MglB family)